MRHRLLVVAIIATSMLALRPSGAAVTVVVAGSTSRTTGSFATPVVVTSASGPLTFLNADVQPHGLASDAFGPQTRPWCGFFDLGKCPLLWAPVTDAGLRTSTVQGLDGASAGTYGVYCTLHPSVRGTVVVV